MEKRVGAAQKTRQQQKQPRKKGSGKGNGGRVFMIIMAIVLVMVVGVGCGFLTATLNTKQDLEDVRPAASSQIYYSDGTELASVHSEENRVPVEFNQIPQNLKDAFVAVEDARFYEHAGVDPRGIMRAVWVNLTRRGVAEGGSTITQQLAKNAYLTQDRTFKRKVQEMFLALQLERKYTKDEILGLYLNQIYFGQGAYGVQAAAKTYFGKDVKDLTLNECAMLAGIPKSPNYYSPLNNLQAAQERKATVLDQMAKYGYISSSTAEKTKKEDLALAKPQSHKDNGVAAYFVDYVTQQMIEKYGADAVYQDGLKIYTTLDKSAQEAAEAAMQNLPNYSTDGNGNKQPQGALVAIEPQTGKILAMVGGRGTDQFNRATLAERQPGSAFKPFVFAAALIDGKTPDTVLDDKPLKIGSWEPQNYSRNFSGKVTMRYVAENSLNVPTVALAQDVGMDKVIDVAEKMGITTFVKEGSVNDRNLAVSLGGMTKGVTPLELTSAYGTLANGGIHVQPIAIIRVVDRNGKELESHESGEAKQAMSSSVANELTSMLMGVIARGTGTGANIGKPAAGKTGTTSDYHDAWFVGYTPKVVAGVWVGCDDNSRMGTMTGGTTPATIWKAFMQKTTAGDNTSFSGASLQAVAAPEKDSKDKDKDKDKDGKDKDGKDKKPASKDPTKPSAPAPQPAAPAPAAPAPVPGGGGKGAN